MTRTSSRSAALAAKSKIVSSEPEIETEANKSNEESDFEDSALTNGSEESENENDPRYPTDSADPADLAEPTTPSRQKKKKLTYLPPISHSWIKNRRCASFQEMSKAMAAFNAVTKRQNRQFMTKLFLPQEDVLHIDESLLCQVDGEAAVPRFTTALSTELELELKLIAPVTLKDSSAFWCECQDCINGPRQLLFLVSQQQGIHAISLQIDAQQGFSSDSVSCVSQCSLPFQVDCCAMKAGYLCLGSNNNASSCAQVFILSTRKFHENISASMKLKATPAITLPNTQLTALTLSSRGLLSGTAGGRIRLHSLPLLQECLQLGLPSAISVYCVLVADEKIVVTGRLNRVLSYSLADGGDWQTEASNLAIIPKVSNSHAGLIYSDVECHARLILSPCHHSPLSASFDSMITCISPSSLHSVIALSSTQGSIYLCWREGLVKKIFPGPAVYWRSSERGEFKPKEVKSTIVTWSRCLASPGVLAVISNDAVRLLICDEYII